MQKIIKRHGNYLLIRFDRGDKEIYGLKAGDILKVQIIKGKTVIRTEKTINKEGGSIALTFNKTEQVEYEFKVGDLIELEIINHTRKNQKEVKR